MSSNLQNPLWPNTDGNLGNIKVQIPTGTDSDTIKWPTGDALVGNFVYQNGKLVGFVDTKALIANDSKSTIFPYEYVNIYLPSIAEGEMTYNHDQCTYFILNGEVLKGDIPTDEELEIITKKYAGCLTVDDIKAVDPNYLTNDIVDGVWDEGLGDLTNSKSMFASCDSLTSFSSDLSSLTDGYHMFASCDNLESFSSDLSSLTEGLYMFHSCPALTSFTSDLSSLTDGYHMFSYSGLESFNSDLSSLTEGLYMFESCDNLESFSSDLSSLTTGYQMFCGCKKLTSFNSDLSSLTEGNEMFSKCYLNTASVQNIADTINTYNNGVIHIGIGNITPNTEESEAFNTIASKGWIVYVQGNFGSESLWNPTSLTPIDGEETLTPIPFWAKPAQSDEKHARYVDSEGNFYNILGGNFIYGDNLENYGMFINEDDAAANMRLTKIEK